MGGEKDGQHLLVRLLGLSLYDHGPVAATAATAATTNPGEGRMREPKQGGN